MTMSNQDSHERRGFPRHPIRDNSAVMLSPDNIISFSVLNISKSGMAFSYNDKGLSSKTLDIAFLYFFGETIGAGNLPVKIISDNEIDTSTVWFSNYDEDGAAKLPYLRRCGIEFGELSKAQEEAIDQYIQSLTENKVVWSNNKSGRKTKGV